MEKERIIGESAVISFRLSAKDGNILWFSDCNSSQLSQVNSEVITEQNIPIIIVISRNIMGTIFLQSLCGI